MDVAVAPLTPGKLEAWEAWVAELNGARKAEFDDLNRRHGVTQHAAWLQQIPDGSYLVIIVTDGPGSADLMGKLVASEHGFDRWFVTKATEVHGLEPTAPPPPAAQRRL